MIHNLKNWASQYAHQIKNHPVSWLTLLTLVFLPASSKIAIPVSSMPKPILKTNFALPTPALYPVNTANTPAPNLSAKGIYIVDTASMAPLYQKNPDLELSPASTTKIMTALVAIDQFSNNDVVTSKTASNAIGKTIHLKSGEQISFENMLYGLLLESGNDTALALGENYKGGYTEMIKAMNKKAYELGMKNTTYQNESGVDQKSHQTTVHDMSILTAYAINNKIIEQIVRTSEREIASLDNKVIHKLKNTNELLGKVPGVLGVKTGWTDNAGECLITLIERENHKIIITLFNSTNRFGETQKLINWIFENHEWQEIGL